VFLQKGVKRLRCADGTGQAKAGDEEPRACE